MKKILYTLLLISPLLFISSCEEEEEAQSGYDCISNTCSAVFESPQYLTLSDCQSACVGNNGGNSNLEIGNIYGGGIIFYLNETGHHGLVAAMEDIEGTYEWGCYTGISGPGIQNGFIVDGADSTSIGTGYQNTIDIANQECSTYNGGITAAQTALDAEINGYSDWYLPSQDEFTEMYNTIGIAGSEGNVGGFDENNLYWSSSETSFDTNRAWYVFFNDGIRNYYSFKYSFFGVRVIRSF